VAKVELIRSIGQMGETFEEVSPKIDGNSVASRSVDPLDKFVGPQSRQTTIENRYKKEQRELVVGKIGRCLYANGFPFNLVNSSYWIEMVEEIGTFGMGLKQPLMHELRTRVLRQRCKALMP